MKTFFGLNAASYPVDFESSNNYFAWKLKSIWVVMKENGFVYLDSYFSSL